MPVPPAAGSTTASRSGVAQKRSLRRRGCDRAARVGRSHEKTRHDGVGRAVERQHACERVSQRIHDKRRHARRMCAVFKFARGERRPFLARGVDHGAWCRPVWTRRRSSRRAITRRGTGFLTHHAVISRQFAGRRVADDDTARRRSGRVPRSPAAAPEAAGGALGRARARQARPRHRPAAPALQPAR